MWPVQTQALLHFHSPGAYCHHLHLHRTLRTRVRDFVWTALPSVHVLQGNGFDIKAINKNSEEESKQWLTYWIVFGFLTAFDTLFSAVLFFLPAYYTFKALFYMWLFYPRTNGAHILYEKVLRPQLKNLKALAEKYHTQWISSIKL